MVRQMVSMVSSRQACKSVTDLRRRQRTKRLGGGGGMSDSSRQLQGEEPVKTEGSGESGQSQVCGQGQRALLGEFEGPHGHSKEPWTELLDSRGFVLGQRLM